MDRFIRDEANSDFTRARNRETIEKLLNLLSPDDQKLLSLREVREALHPKSESYRGLQVVSIDRIVGSEGRYRDFNKRFLPRYEHLRSRWTSVDQAMISQVPLPPIRLYEIGGVYFVRMQTQHRVETRKVMLLR